MILERVMEDLIAGSPDEFFPSRGFVLKGRQQSFDGGGGLTSFLLIDTKQTFLWRSKQLLQDTTMLTSSEGRKDPAAKGEREHFKCGS